MWSYRQNPSDNDWLSHYGIKGQKWGVRRFQNEDGSYTEEGKQRYSSASKNGANLNNIMDIVSESIERIDRRPKNYKGPVTDDDYTKFQNNIDKVLQKNKEYQELDKFVGKAINEINQKYWSKNKQPPTDEWAPIGKANEKLEALSCLIAYDYITKTYPQDYWDDLLVLFNYGD